MIKMFLALDKEKIIQDEIITVEEVEESIMRDITCRKIHKDENGFYVGENLCAFLGLIASWWEVELFLSYIKEWKLYDSDITRHNGYYLVEDILAFKLNGESWEGVENGYYYEQERATG